ncbi:MAG: DUF4976 domain-containing protein, partial [Bacteroidales bacterium]|nr:DUF4976 domain-containing protein [Bacteroidales bacterium]
QEKLWNKKPVEELYDWQTDPQELNNLAGDPAYAEIINRLKSKMHDWMVETHDLGLLPEAEYMIRSEGSSPYEYARESGDFQPAEILEAAEMVGVAGEKEILEKLEALYDGPDSTRKFKDFNYASFTGWALEWALQELGEDIQVN